MPIKNYTTKVNENRTVAEIQALLSEKGAACIQIDYDGGKPQAIRFMFEVQAGMPVPFRLPCNFDGVRKAMLREMKRSSTKHRAENSAEFQERVRWIAWRIVKDWVEAQMALIEANQAALPEIFMPYAESASGQTLYLYWKEKMLPAERQLSSGVN